MQNNSLEILRLDSLD